MIKLEDQPVWTMTNLIRLKDLPVYFTMNQIISQDLPLYSIINQFIPENDCGKDNLSLFWEIAQKRPHCRWIKGLLL